MATSDTPRPKIQGKNVTISNLSEDQYNRLVELAGRKNMSLTGYIKYMIETSLTDAPGGFW